MTLETLQQFAVKVRKFLYGVRFWFERRENHLVSSGDLTWHMKLYASSVMQYKKDKHGPIIIHKWASRV